MKVTPKINSIHVFAFLLTFRLFNSLIIRTFFQPDEYYQSLEPAWYFTFGPNSGAYLTWEWKHHLRSSLHPMLFGVFYKFIDTITNSSPFALLIAPKLLQSLLSTLIDYNTWKFSTLLFSNKDISWTILLLSILNPWQFFISIRTFSNCLETTLTSIALVYWEENLSICLILAAFAFILRPTNILIWLPIGLNLFLKSNFDQKLYLIIKAGVSGSIAFFTSFLIDFYYYKSWSIPLFQFLNLNVKQDLASFYGINRIDYYFTEGLGLLLTTFLPFTLYGIYNEIIQGKTICIQSKPLKPPKSSESLKFSKSSKPVSPVSPSLPPNQSYQLQSSYSSSITLKTLSWTTIFVLFVLSTISHKEVRFIYPLLPILHIVSGYYITQIHQRGVIDVVNYVRIKHEYENQVRTKISTVGILMPCHSTPWRSHLLYNDIKVWSLTCEPPIGLSLKEREVYLDEADIFYQNPSAWFDENVGNDKLKPWPENFIFFQQLEPFIKEKLKDTLYKECWRGFNSHWHDDWRRKGDVILWCNNE